MRLTKPQTLAALGVIAFLLIVVGVLLLRPTTVAGPTMVSESAKLAACRKETLDAVKPDKIDLSLLQQVSTFCYGQVRGADLLDDFNIRRTNYVRQQFQGLVFLWMVVAITISGVILAAVQLAAAYKLAVGGHGTFEAGGEIAIEEKRLSLKSSVTGLLILTVSFAFFIVFVIWVYPLTETRISPEGGAPATQSGPLLGAGGLGRPPTGAPPAPGAPK